MSLFILLRNGMIIGLLLLLAACSGFMISGEKPVAWVDGVPVTEGDLKEALKITHRTEAVRPGEHLDLMDYVNKLIDERLIVQEAYRMELDKDPWVQNKLHEYKLRESVVRLYKEEVQDRARVSDDEMRRFYNEQMEATHIRQITVGTEEEARNIRAQIEAGSDMAALAREHSIDMFKDKGGDRGFLHRWQLPESARDAAFSLKDGQITPVIKTSSGYQIIKIEEKRPAPEKSLEEIRQVVEKPLRKKKEEELGQEVLKRYRKQADIVISVSEDLVAELPLSIDAAKDEKWAKDERPIVKIGEEILTVGQFCQQLKDIPESKLVTDDPLALKRKFIDNWIDRKLVDIAALNRHYEQGEDFGRLLKYYEEYLLKKLFAQKVIYPQIKVSDELLKDYYDKHRDRYLKPVHYRIRQITVTDEAQARTILEQLRGGADFAWLAKNKSEDSLAQKGGDRGWISEDKLSFLSEAVSALKVGENSDVLSEGGAYYIVKLEAKSDVDYEDFEQIKDVVQKDYIKENYEHLWTDYARELRQDAEVKINDPFIQELTERFLPTVKSSTLDKQ
ncbi:MAG: peptidyl-prolyl cis-trans isomerase [Thermodesulfobacteriota bacterium]|nr:peptidyl-prolyl cis-trans isomerase [Thermodesulfobacteriota bacterium]